MDGAFLLFDVLSSLATEFVRVVPILCRCGGAGIATDFGHAEQGLPPLNDATAGWCWITEAGSDQSTFSPSIVDASNVPVNPVGRCVAVELIADIDQNLNGCDVDIVDRREIEDDGLERGTFGMVLLRFTTSRTRVVPWTILCAKKKINT